MIITKQIVQTELNDLTSLFKSLETIINKYPEILDYYKKSKENKKLYFSPPVPEINQKMIDELIVLSNSESVFEFNDNFKFKLEFENTIIYIYKNKKNYSFPLCDFYKWKEELLKSYSLSFLNYSEKKQIQALSSFRTAKLNNYTESIYNKFFNSEGLYKSKTEILYIISSYIEQETNNLNLSFTNNLKEYFKLNITQLEKLKQEVKSTNYEFKNKQIKSEKFFENFQIETKYCYLKLDFYNILTRYDLLNYDFTNDNINEFIKLMFILNKYETVNFDNILNEKETKLNQVIKEFEDIFEYKNKKNNIISYKNIYYSHKNEKYVGIEGIRNPKNNYEKKTFNSLLSKKINLEEEISLLINHKEFILNLKTK
jgi:hypothetical protein